MCVWVYMPKYVHHSIINESKKIEASYVFQGLLFFFHCHVLSFSLAIGTLVCRGARGPPVKRYQPWPSLTVNLWPLEVLRVTSKMSP